MDRGVVVFLDQLFADDNGVFEVIAAPGHKGHENVATQRQLAFVGARPVGQNIALSNPLPLVDDRLLADTGVLIGALKFGHRVDVRAHLAGKLALLGIALHTHNDALAID